MFNRKKKNSNKRVIGCKFRYMTELIGFEDDFRFACTCMKHPDATMYFVNCCAEKCPKGRYD